MHVLVDLDPSNLIGAGVAGAEYDIVEHIAVIVVVQQRRLDPRLVRHSDVLDITGVELGAIHHQLIQSRFNDILLIIKCLKDDNDVDA